MNTFYVVAETLDDAVTSMEYLIKFKSFTDADRERKRNERLILKVFMISIQEIA